MAQWEYRIVIGHFEEFHDLTARLNELGDDGWEAVGLSENDDDFAVLLKRERAVDEKKRPA